MKITHRAKRSGNRPEQKAPEWKRAREKELGGRGEQGKRRDGQGGGDKRVRVKPHPQPRVETSHGVLVAG